MHLKHNLWILNSVVNHFPKRSFRKIMVLPTVWHSRWQVVQYPWALAAFGEEVSDIWIRVVAQHKTCRYACWIHPNLTAVWKWTHLNVHFLGQKTFLVAQRRKRSSVSVHIKCVKPITSLVAGAEASSIKAKLTCTYQVQLASYQLKIRHKVLLTT